ncbi:MAG: NAD(P)/FAD-dependent oxidoreductase [Thermoplasmataceae archaeon]
MESAEIVIIGGGIVGLSVAASLSENNREIYVLEKNRVLGLETSSHNSGVIHSGIYYPPGSLKAVLCRKGNEHIYSICEKYHIPFRKLGKLIVATDDSGIAELEKLLKNGERNGIQDLRMLDSDQIRTIEPNVLAKRAIYSPSTGIIEPDSLMDYFRAKALRNGVTFVPETMVTGISRISDGYELMGVSSGQRFSIRSDTVINSAGLQSDRIAEMAGIDINSAGYRLHYCKGDYFRLSGPPPVRSLVYPVPNGPGLGIHLTPDMAGSIKLGPNAYYVDKVDYKVESSPVEFLDDVIKFAPSIADREIVADSSGIRPKLQGPGEGFRDFAIRHEKDRGLQGFIDLIGIESPGLTASPAIGEYISQIYDKEIKH